jgi:hypothetical protein
MDPSDLKVGDRIRIIGIPGEGRPNYYLHPDTKRVFKKLIARAKSVRIDRIDAQGPWYTCRFRMKNGHSETHFVAVALDDTNWVKVKRRHKGRVIPRHSNVSR